jgi:hypothetical protein
MHDEACPQDTTLPMPTSPEGTTAPARNVLAVANPDDHAGFRLVVPGKVTPGDVDPAVRREWQQPQVGRCGARAPLKIPEWLPTTPQAIRLRVACKARRPREPIDSGDCGEKAEGRRQNEQKRGRKGEIRGKRAKLNRPSRERRRSEYVAGGAQGGWPAMNSRGRSCQSSINWLARRNSTGPTGG